MGGIMYENCFEVLANIFKNNNLSSSTKKKGINYFLEFQSKPLELDGNIVKYTLRGLSHNKIEVYKALLDVHKEFNIDLSFLNKTDMERLTEYSFYLSDKNIEGIFSSIRRI